MIDKFKFSILSPRSIDIDKSDYSILNELCNKVPSFKRCMNCGSCTASCSAQAFTDFNIRQIQCFCRLGQYKNLYNMLNSCMLCGKCTLVCPRGVNLRAAIVELRQLLSNQNVK